MFRSNKCSIPIRQPMTEERLGALVGLRATRHRLALSPSRCSGVGGGGAGCCNVARAHASECTALWKFAKTGVKRFENSCVHSTCIMFGGTTQPRSARPPLNNHSPGLLQVNRLRGRSERLVVVRGGARLPRRQRGPRRGRGRRPCLRCGGCGGGGVTYGAHGTVMLAAAPSRHLTSRRAI
jgi:hypothetical protein